MSWQVLVLATVLWAVGEGDAETKPGVGVERARALMEAADQASERGDPLAAIDKLTEAYHRLPPGSEQDPLRHRLRLELAAAHAQAFGVDNDTRHLELALDLLSAGISDLDVEDVEGRAELAERRDKLAGRLVQAKAKQIDEFEQRQRDRSAYLASRVHRVWVPNSIDEFYTVGFDGARLPPLKVLEVIGDEQLRRKLIRRRRVRISLAAVGGPLLVAGGVLFGVPIRTDGKAIAGGVLIVAGTTGLLVAAFLPSQRVGGDELRDSIRDYNQDLERRYGIDRPARVFPSEPQAETRPTVELSLGAALLPRGGGVVLGGRF